jgi:hypothetical protein
VITLNIIKELILIMETLHVFFEVRTVCLSSIKTSFAFEGLIMKMSIGTL